MKAKISLKTIKAVYETHTVAEQDEKWITQAYVSADHAYEMFKHLSVETKEHFFALHLDAKHKVLCRDLVSIGSLTASIVSPREVLKTALLSSASAMIFIHNHPSGDPTPSREDLDITRRLHDAADLFGIRVLDHVIIGNDGYYSLADHGNI
jgi:DNA repair protein RadC